MVKIENLPSQIKLTTDTSTVFYQKLDGDGDVQLSFEVQQGDLVFKQNETVIGTFDYSVVQEPITTDIDNLVDTLNDYLFTGSLPTTANITTGTYTGDGTTSNAITGLGFPPSYVKIVASSAADLTANIFYETWDELNDDAPTGQGLAHTAIATLEHIYINESISSLDADGFTVSDRSINADPNAVGVTYNYVAFG